MNPEPEDIDNCYHDTEERKFHPGFIVQLWIPYHIWNGELKEGGYERLVNWIDENITGVKI
jgi:hypothetical protein